MFSAELINALNTQPFSIQQKPAETSSQPRNIQYGVKLEERRYRGRYMVIATAIGYYAAKKKGFNDKLAKALGYGFAIMPNIIKNGSRVGIGRDRGLFVSKPKQVADNDDLLVEQGLVDKVKQVKLGTWAFEVLGDKACAPRMKPKNNKIVWWTDLDFEKQMMKLTPKQEKKMFEVIKREYENFHFESPDWFDRKCYGNGWQTFIQPYMEKVGDAIYGA